MDIHEKLRISILKLLNSNELRFFGALLYNLELSIIPDQDLKPEIQYNLHKDINLNSIKENLEYFTELRDCILKYNKEKKRFEISFFESFLNSSDISEIIFTIIHNILHLLNKHNIRNYDKNKEIYNIASDHVVNNQLKTDIVDNKFKIINYPKHALIISDLKYKNLTTEEVYNYLIDYQLEDEKNKINNCSVKLQNINFCINTISINGKRFTHIENIEHIEESENNEIQTLNELNLSASLLLEQESFTRGLKGSSVFQYLKKITEIKIPWYKLLERAILVNSKTNPDSRIWTNPLKRLRPHNIILPGIGKKKDLDTLCVCIDTSGSISDNNLSKFAGICLSAFDRFNQIWLLKHDTKITTNEFINSNNADKDKFIIEIKGRGGTSHEKVYDEIENKFLNNTIKIGLIIFLTDFESDIQYIWRKYKWTKIIPCIHLLTDKHYINDIPKQLDNNPLVIDDF